MVGLGWARVGILGCVVLCPLSYCPPQPSFGSSNSGGWLWPTHSPVTAKLHCLVTSMVLPRHSHGIALSPSSDCLVTRLPGAGGGAITQCLVTAVELPMVGLWWAYDGPMVRLSCGGGAAMVGLWWGYGEARMILWWG